MALRRLGPSFLVAAVVALTVLALPTPAAADAVVSPPVAVADEPQLFTLVVEPEQEDALTTIVELYAPPGFEIQSFAPSPGWERDWTIQSGKTIVQRAVWTREEDESAEAGEEDESGEADEDEEFEEAAEQDAVFGFVARPKEAKEYEFEVRQTYANGKVVHWRGAATSAFSPTPREGSIRPPVIVTAQSSAAPDDGPSTIAIIALVLAAGGLVVATAALLVRRATPC